MMQMSDNPASTETTDFGFRRVPRAAKGGLVRAVFDSVAPRYDVMNDLMSLGIHRAWKDALVTALDPGPRRMLLDLAAGTGDVGLAWLERGGGLVLMSDVNASMLDVAHDRALSRGLIGGMSLLVADAERVPLPDRAVDRVSIAFGLRNCTDKSAVLAEARRVLRPGGTLLFLEHVRAGDARLARFQDRMNWLNRLVVQCDCNRPTLATIESEGFSVSRLERTTMPKAPKFVRPLILGTALPAGTVA
jgi:demethylmenaquinone methyltransferase/2-methoxy-6-polyprenyl-1,4-benzoquinol methylase